MKYLESIEKFNPTNAQEANDRAVILDFAAHHPETILTRENQVAHLTSSGFIMNEKLDKVLMVHHNIYKTWTWTGGHVDGNGDFLEVAIQEAMEETGVSSIKPLSKEIISVDILPVYGHEKRGRYVSSHLHLNVAYVLIADESQALLVKPDENSGVKWVPIEAIETHSNESYLIHIYHKIIEKVTSQKERF
ncbi:NUDIX hydrolase [Fusibacter ferrireducens]|uniref:NUDIX hydrolase n=1 Tax=Fusibacter ferrireducens TaxID=2785058 RepID=A0ABR9ZR21_9FIRM|nr:NUDIX hydrolase [Fusibacter ferrireducens]MBF4692900.1 NUDIX hydrolase [Fusibacter ferrireducens]